MQAGAAAQGLPALLVSSFALALLPPNAMLLSRAAAVRAVLLDFVVARNCVTCCNKEGLLKHLEAQQAELELCEKASMWRGSHETGERWWLAKNDS